MRDQLVALSIDFQRAPLDLRERLALPRDAIAGRLASLPASFSERLILSTCNRLELYALTSTAPDGEGAFCRWLAATCDMPAPFVTDSAAIYEQQQAVLHLFRVAAGLESMVLGEPQILTQIDDALTIAREAGAAGPVLQRLATEALRVGKRARTETGIARNRCSLPHVAVDLAASELHGLDGRRAVIVGAGKTGALAAKLLRGANVADLVILNRSAERGRQVAGIVDGRFAPLTALPVALATAEVAIAAVTVSSPLIGPDSVRPLRQRRSPLLAIDLGVPRNIDPAVSAAAPVHLIDLDQLRPHAEARQRCFEREIRSVETLTTEAAGEFLAWWQGRAAATTIAALRAQAEAIRQAELDHTLRKLGHLSERDRNVVSALSVRLINTLLHQPSKALRETSQPALTAQLAQELFGLAAMAPGDEPPGAGAAQLPARKEPPIS